MITLQIDLAERLLDMLMDYGLAFVVMGIMIYFMYRHIMRLQKEIAKKDDYIREVHERTTRILKDTTESLKDVTSSNRDVTQDLSAHMSHVIAMTERNILQEIKELVRLYNQYNSPGKDDR